MVKWNYGKKEESTLKLKQAPHWWSRLYRAIFPFDTSNVEGTQLILLVWIKRSPIVSSVKGVYFFGKFPLG